LHLHSPCSSRDVHRTSPRNSPHCDGTANAYGLGRHWSRKSAKEHYEISTPISPHSNWNLVSNPRELSTSTCSRKNPSPQFAETAHWHALAARRCFFVRRDISIAAMSSHMR